MAKDILSEYGLDTPKTQVPRATNGGVIKAKPLAYSTPVGPINQTHVGPGLGGGTNYGHNGSQGMSEAKASESGSSGLGGEKLQHGAERITKNNPGSY